MLVRRKGDVRVQPAVHHIAVHARDVGGRVRVLHEHVLGRKGPVADHVVMITTHGADGGKNDGIRYYIRKLGEDSYSITITDKNGGILSIDTWAKKGGSIITRQQIIDGLANSGATPPNGFWESL